MNLIQYVEKHRTQANAAKSLGLTQGMISARLNGRYKMTPNAAIDLEKRSKGEISKHDLLPDIFPKMAETYTDNH